MMTVKEFLNSFGLTASFKGLWIVLDEYFRVFEKEAIFAGVKEVFINLDLRMALNIECYRLQYFLTAGKKSLSLLKA